MKGNNHDLTSLALTPVLAAIVQPYLTGIGLAILVAGQSQGVEVTVIDHHAPKFPELEGFANAILDADECGATLAWKHFFPGEAQPPILAHVRRRDIGADDYYKAPDNCLESKQITAAMSWLRKEADSGNARFLIPWLEFGMEQITELRKIGEELQAQDEAKAQQIAATAVVTTMPKFCPPVACWKVVIGESENDRLISQTGLWRQTALILCAQAA
jgi:hypothetical protein